MVAMNATIKHIDFSQAYSHTYMGEICYAIPPDDFRDPASQFPPSFADDVRSMPWRDGFRFTDKGDVEVFYGMQFKMIVGLQMQSRLRHHARTKSHNQLMRLLRCDSGH
eukprot:g1833.t1